MKGARMLDFGHSRNRDLTHRRPSSRHAAMAFSSDTSRRLVALTAALVLMFGLMGVPNAQAATLEAAPPITWLTADDFVYGTYIIDQPGIYRLAEDISFNPNSPETLTDALNTGAIPPELAPLLELPNPVDAYHAGNPLFTQFQFEGGDAFTPGGPLDARYDPAAYGVGFFAAIAISADDVILDLNGHTIEQSAEHALLQRFFAVIELADQPFVPNQGPSGFGDEIDPAKNVTILNGTLGLSAHHGIHGNGNENVTVANVDFVDYEVGAIALNGVDGLTVTNVTATNRKDVPVLGTFSSGRFIASYINDLVRSGSTTTLTVGDETLTAVDVQADLAESINNAHYDLVANPNVVDGRAQIDSSAHPAEHALYNNPTGLIDGNSYSFLLNQFGVAVDGFPTAPDGVTKIPSKNVAFRNVHVYDQQSFINEVLAIDVGDGKAAIDPVGAVFQIRNVDPATGEPVTISDNDDALATYTGNAVANAQALVAKATLNGDFDSSTLDVSRVNINDAVLDWIEGEAGYETLADAGLTYVCNGDSMFHVNKGAIAFKMDAAVGVQLTNTSVNGLTNVGAAGSTLCGDYENDYSHPLALLPGYGGANVRGYTFSGSTDVMVNRSTVNDLYASWGSAVGFDVIADGGDIRIFSAMVDNLNAGVGGPSPIDNPTAAPMAVGFHVGVDAGAVLVARSCATALTGQPEAYELLDHTGLASFIAGC